MIKEQYFVRAADFVTYGGKEHHIDFNIMDEKDKTKEKLFTCTLKAAREKVLDIFCIPDAKDPIVKVKKLYIVDFYKEEQKH